MCRQAEKHRQRCREVKPCSGFGQRVCVDLGVAGQGRGVDEGGAGAHLAEVGEGSRRALCAERQCTILWSHRRVTAGCGLTST